MDEIERLDQITGRIIACAIAVPRAVGPGLLESAYQACLRAEFKAQGVSFREQVELPLHYRGEQLDCGYRLDFIVEEEVIVELKAVERYESIHKAQMISYLRMSGKRAGLLINFNVDVLKSGIQRVVNNFPGLGALGASAVK